MSYISQPNFAPYPGCEGEWMSASSFTGKSKTFGYFGCNYCQKQWMSAHARKGFKQGCKDCERYFYPLYLWKNKQTYQKKEKALEDNGKPHRSDLCQACKKGVCDRMFSNNSSKYDSGQLELIKALKRLKF